MAEMSGTDAMQVLRRDPASAAVPIVAFTAHALAKEKPRRWRQDSRTDGQTVPDKLMAAVIVGSPGLAPG